MMMKYCNTIISATILCLSTTLLVASQQPQPQQRHVVPTFFLDELQLGHRLPELSEILRTTGLFAIKTTGATQAAASPSQLEAMNGLCQCLLDQQPQQQQQQQQQDSKTKKIIGSSDSMDSILLQDGHTQRTTIATATIGQDPLPLTDDLAKLCGSTTANAMEIVRDEVAIVSKAVVQSMDRLLLGGGSGSGSSTSTSTSTRMTYDKKDEGPLLETKYGSVYRTMASIVHSANHLEHFHHYQNSNKQTTTTQESPFSKTVEWHTDAGLFLTFLPAHDCESGGAKQDDSFHVQLPDGQQAQAYFEPGSVAVMMGAGAEHWLSSPSSSSINFLKATRHAVQMKSSTSRVWYGMMHLVPEDSIIQESPRRTFGDMKQNMKVSSQQQGAMDDETISIGCGPSTDDQNPSLLTNNNDIVISPTRRRRRRLQHVQDAAACNNVTNFFCWTQCLEIPNYQQAESYINEGNSLYCLDPGILARSGNQVSKAVEPCTGSNIHNSNCQGIWHQSSPSVEGWPVEYNSTVQYEEKYCYGGTSMYMDGFHWIHDTTCVIYLFPSLVLSSQARFIGACFGTILFGMMVEAIIFRRRKSIVNFSPGMSRLLASAGFYALQLTMGYLVMLIVMTYSIPLFLCCISGLVLGHVVFNARDALLNRESTSADDGVENDSDRVQDDDEGGCGCHEEKQSFSNTSTEGTQAQSCCSSKTEKNPAKDRSQGIPEGSTPCCQNSLDVC